MRKIEAIECFIKINLRLLRRGFVTTHRKELQAVRAVSLSWELRSYGYDLFPLELRCIRPAMRRQFEPATGRVAAWRRVLRVDLRIPNSHLKGTWRPSLRST